MKSRKPIRYAVVRVAAFSLLGAAIAIPLIDWYSRPRGGDVSLRPRANQRSVNYPSLPTDGDFRPSVALPYAMEAITEFPIASAEQADAELHEAELVLGVTVGDQSRAYPINTLTGPSREIINDQLGGRAIAATW